MLILAYVSVVYICFISADTYNILTTVSLLCSLFSLYTNIYVQSYILSSLFSISKPPQ